MSKIDYLTLVSGVDVYVPELKIVIRPPKIKEIAMLGEKRFYEMCSFLLVEKEKVLERLSQERDPNIVQQTYGQLSEYQILLALMASSTTMTENAIQILSFLFPEYNINLEEMGIIFIGKNGSPIVIPDESYPLLRDYIKEILCLNSKASSEEFNPADEAAKAIAEKLKKRKQRLDELKPTEDKYVIANYLSSLGAGSNGYNLIDGIELTLFQLFDWVKRHGYWDKYRVDVQAMLAGAKDVQIQDWFSNLE